MRSWMRRSSRERSSACAMRSVGSGGSTGRRCTTDGASDALSLDRVAQVLNRLTLAGKWKSSGKSPACVWQGASDSRRARARPLTQCPAIGSVQPPNRLRNGKGVIRLLQHAIGRKIGLVSITRSGSEIQGKLTFNLLSKIVKLNPYTATRRSCRKIVSGVGPRKRDGQAIESTALVQMFQITASRMRRR